MNEVHVQGLCLDSREVKPGDLFIALAGHEDDGRRYIPEAIAKGAAAILVETNAKASLSSDIDLQQASISSVSIIAFSHLRDCVSAIAGRFFSEPSQHLSVIAITGTNGKTSISHFIAQMLTTLQHSCAVMGTLGSGFLSALQHQNKMMNTTIDPINVQRTLANLKEQGAEVVAMEVTSHALSQGRVEGLHFKTAIFTNLTRDHLDYHKDMQNYFAAKKRLFTALKPKNVIVNLDDEHGQKLVQELLSLRARQSDFRQNIDKPRILCFSLFADRVEQFCRENIEAKKSIEFVVARDLCFTKTGLQAKLTTPWGEGDLICPLLGQFNLSNVLAALTAICLEGLAFHKVLEALKLLKIVAGRMSSYTHEGKGPQVIIDYAHTPDALSQVLQALRLHCPGKLWCVFGCGGDRDRGKRAEMAAVAEALSDHIIVTQDNPRTEDPNRIMQDIMQGFKNMTKVQQEPDRKTAIALAVQHAATADMVLIAGKGHEDYQIMGEKKIPFSDQQEVLQALEGRRS